MDEKTEELRDIFIDATGAETVTEQQTESPGSLADDSTDDERVRELLEELHETHEPVAGLTLGAYETVARSFFDGADDQQIADELDTDAETVLQARLDCHLVRESDRDAPFDLAELRSLVVENVSPETAADELNADADTVAEYLPVVRTDIASTRANDRFRDGLAELLSDEELGERLAVDAREDGLDDATEDIETNVSL